MIIKQCQFSGVGSTGPLVHLLHPGYGNEHLIKTAAASPPQIRQIREFVKRMPRNNGVLNVLVSALGAGEYWGSNSNGDYFGEEPLLHVPRGWMDMPHEQQKLVGKRWEWGYPTFYNAHAFQHHVNKDPARAFGTVEYVLWDPYMKRVLLVISLDRERARRFGATGVIDRIENGEFPDVSMGCRVPFDLCSVCSDWDRIQPHVDNPKILLAEHRRRPIRGLSTVTSEYCQHLQSELNQIYPDGRKVKMLNIHPRFFDLSLVFIGADKTSKVLAKLAHKQCPIRVNSPMCKQGCTKCSPAHAIPSSHVYDVWDREKIAGGRRPPEEWAPKARSGYPKFVNRGRDPGPYFDEGDNRTFEQWVWDDELDGLRHRVWRNREQGLHDLHMSKRERRTLKKWPKDRLERSAEKHFMRTELASLGPRPRKPKLRYGQVEIKKTASDEQLLKQAFGYDDLDDYIPDREHDQVSSYFQRRRTAPLTKRSEITKRVRSHFSGKALPALQATEPDLPTDIQDRMSDRLSDSLSSCGGMGIVAKPREFQRMYIRSIGRPELADELDEKKIRFRMGRPPSGDFGLSGRIIPSLIKTLLPMLGARSAFGPPLHRRVIIVIHKKPPIEEEDHECMDHPLLDKISSAYSSYRRDLMYKTASLVRTAMHENQDIILALYGCGLDRAFHGGLAKVGSDVVESMLGTLPATYLNRAYYVGPVSEYVEEHSDLTGLITAGGLASVGGVA